MIIDHIRKYVQYKVYVSTKENKSPLLYNKRQQVACTFGEMNYI